MSPALKKTFAALLLIVAFTSLYLYFFTPAAVEHIPVPEVRQEEEVVTETPTVAVVGTSVEGRVLETYTYGSGSTTLLFVGGVHGGYEWNSVLLAYEIIDALESATLSVPASLRVVVLPVLNPDGLYAVVGMEGRFTATDVPATYSHASGLGRFNANGVDLNRNFDCKWARESSWRGAAVSAGSAPFSEPEAQALRAVVTDLSPTAVVFWHSQANTVYGSECEAGILPETLGLMNTYAEAANYNAVAAFDAYPITGDAEGWLASQNIPAVTVELETRNSTEYNRNLAALEALFRRYSE